tara:strand:+ start:2798 stop:4624 length:1827 start_codon:yes stop_codon:yes gene_type:complete
MASINGQVDWGFQPLDFSNSILQQAFNSFRSNYLKSANDNLRYQIVYDKPNLTEAIEPNAVNFNSNTQKGDLVNVVFTVKVKCTGGAYQTIAVISKSRDIISRNFNDIPAQGHRFTIDISQLLQDELSYSLCPIGKGTWQSSMFGGMNGGLIVQDNVINNTGSLQGSPISDFNVSKNGTYRIVQVDASFIIVNAQGELVDATDAAISSHPIAVINSVNQVERDSVFYGSSQTRPAYMMGSSSNTSVQVSQAFLSRCKNFARLTNIPFMKPVRMDEEGEFLQFYFRRASVTDISGSGDPSVGDVGLKVETFSEDRSSLDTFYLRDFEDLLSTTGSGTNQRLENSQERTVIQNVSPAFINSTAPTTDNPNLGLKNVSNNGATATWPYWTNYTGDKITDSVAYYRVSVSRIGFVSPYTEKRCSEFRYFVIDRETAKTPYEFVRFHWLNSMGGIDSFTAKKNIAEGINISRDVIDRKATDRTWYQNKTDSGAGINDLDYISDTMRGGDIYKGGREVINVRADRNLSVYTEPLNQQDAKWLEEIMTSPNVWIEMQTDATETANTANNHLRPSLKEYIPVIITNSDVETVNQELGLVSFNIEYTLAHQVRTQRN